MQILPGIFKCSFGIPESNVPSKQAYIKEPKLEAIKDLPIADLPFDLTKIKFDIMSRGCVLELPMSEEDIYGLGLQLKSIRHTAKKRTLRVNSDPSTDTGDSHAPAPIYFSTKGYGVLVDTARYATFYCGGNEKNENEVEYKDQHAGRILLSEEELYAATQKSVAPMIVDIPGASGVDVYIFTGPSMLDALRRYVLFSGGGCLPPEWGLGCWYRTCGTSDAENIIKLSKEFREKGIPCDVLGLEPGWQSKSYSCSFMWSKERFPEPENFVETLQSQGYHINLWEHAFVHPSSPMFKDLKPYSGDFMVWNGLVPDFIDYRGFNIFCDYHAKNFTAQGISSFKLDECDNSDFIASPWSFPECSQFPSGQDGEQMHSMFGMLYMNAIETACRKSGIRTYGSVRNAHAFSAPAPFVLYSDLYNHEDFIRGVVSASFSGMLWTPELRHAASVEDYIRRLQAMVLSPQMLLNIWSMPHPPWQQLNRELNCAGELFEQQKQNELESITRKILGMRMQFLPYLYSAFAHYHFFGIPPCRALVVDYPEDSRFRNVDYAWLVGDRLLVVPFRAGMTELTMPLPPGAWYDFYTGKEYHEEVTLMPSLEELPILVKGDSVLPLAKVVPFVGDSMKFTLEVKTFGDNPEPMRLFADDGYSFDYEDGKYAWGNVYFDRLDDSLKRRYQLII